MSSNKLGDVKRLEPVLDILMPPAKLTVSEWADRYRIIPPTSSPEPGRWYSDRAKYQKGVMDILSDDTVKVVVLEWASQTGKTEIVLNTIGYYMHYEPAPILLLLPTEATAKDFSKYRIQPMIDYTPALKGLFGEGNDPNNTTLLKVFSGGYLSIASAGSASDLASKPIRILIMDEVDRFPIDTQGEGDPVALAIRRTQNYWNSKILVTSTPTMEGTSRIHALFQETDQRKFYVPCPVCGEFQELQWKNVHWENADPDTAYYECEKCHAHWDDVQLKRAVRHGEWRPTAKSRRKGWVGFHLWAIYSPWVSLPSLVAEFLEAKKKPERLKVFVNTALAEVWRDDESASSFDTSMVDTLMRLREQYRAEIPADVQYITCGVDVQMDRLEAVILGRGTDETFWVIDHITIWGSPTVPETDPTSPWASLYRNVITRNYSTEDGGIMQLSATFIDSGAFTQDVYSFVKAHLGERIYAVKGFSGALPIISKIRRTKYNVPIIEIGVDAVKDIIYSRLHASDRQFFHFPLHLRRDFFEQLLSEKPVTRFSRGYQITRGWKKIRERNEALDATVYAIAAFYLVQEVSPIPKMRNLPQKPVEPPPQQKPVQSPRRRKGGWISPYHLTF